MVMKAERPQPRRCLIRDELLHSGVSEHALGLQMLYPHPQLGAQPLSRALPQPPHFLALASGASHQAGDAFLLQGSAFVVCLDPACDAKIGALPKCGPHAVIPRRNDHRR
jgi:hypothetical protein